MKDYEQLISTLLTKIAELEQVVKQQAARIADLERRLNKKSSNSSKPPSSDGLGKPPRTTSLRENGKHKSGGQTGHKGETLKQTEAPDVVKKHVLTTCPDCQHTLLQSLLIGIVKRQVFDIPPPKIEVTQHQAEVKYCTCNNVLYVGVTSDLIRRIYEHKNKLVKGLTQKYNVGRLVYYEACDNIVVAIEREKQIKGWSRKRRMTLFMHSILNGEIYTAP